MINAKKEFIDFCEGYPKIKCARLHFGYDYSYNSSYEPANYIDLKINYTTEKYNEFLNKLDVEYDNGFGGQELFGIIWFEDGTFGSRGEYDGSEWWRYTKCPEIPNELVKE
jgi:hypothetical protein